MGGGEEGSGGCPGRVPTGAQRLGGSRHRDGDLGLPRGWWRDAGGPGASPAARKLLSARKFSVACGSAVRGGEKALAGARLSLRHVRQPPVSLRSHGTRVASPRGGDRVSGAVINFSC